MSREKELWRVDYRTTGQIDRWVLIREGELVVRCMRTCRMCGISLKAIIVAQGELLNWWTCSKLCREALRHIELVPP